MIQRYGTQKGFRLLGHTSTWMAHNSVCLPQTYCHFFLKQGLSRHTEGSLRPPNLEGTNMSLDYRLSTRNQFFQSYCPVLEPFLRKSERQKSSYWTVHVVVHNVKKGKQSEVHTNSRKGNKHVASFPGQVLRRKRYGE